MGMHHDGLQYYALDGSRRGLLAINQEYTDDGLLHPDGQKTWTPEKVKKAQAAHGITVIEIEQQGQRLAGGAALALRAAHHRQHALCHRRPAAGHPLMKTAADPAGRTVLGTIGNCASGKTPWGTYLSGEENWANYFTAADTPTAHERRWGIRKATWYRWPEHDERFDTVRHPNEPNRFGWIVEVDPMDPDQHAPSSARRWAAPRTKAPGWR
jgi:secreted PhoX family phosphatase